MRLENDKVILRDFIKEDIEDIIRWESIETEWQLWDAPWENNNEFNSQEYKEKTLYLLSNKKDDVCIRHKFQICIKDQYETHIGWCNIYKINSDFKYTTSKGNYAIGIDILEVNVRRNGYATAAWELLIDYLISNDIKDIYTQTWSGNLRLIGLATKIGFEECNRILNERFVRGTLYDRITFKLNITKFKKR
ncbi:hypothetical protein C3495_07080 [Clostridiaceae bacterium 14S0207]|nr:hypothetical protein C3495_07080 [Clostridiaceae bacterium 14S0207]